MLKLRHRFIRRCRIADWDGLKYAVAICDRMKRYGVKCGFLFAGYVVTICDEVNYKSKFTSNALW